MHRLGKSRRLTKVARPCRQEEGQPRGEQHRG